MQAPRTPSPALAGHYAVVGVEPGEIETVTHGRVDLRDIDLATAAALVATGRFPYLVAEPAEAQAAEPAAPDASDPVAPDAERPRRSSRKTA